MREMGINNKAEILYIKLKLEDGQGFINFLKKDASFDFFFSTV